MKLVKNPSYYHSRELLDIFRKYSTNIYQKDSTQYPNVLFKTVIDAVVSGKRYGLKQIHLLWLTKKIWELKLSEKVVRDDYLPVIKSLINNQKLLKIITEYKNIGELNMHVNEVLRTDESVPLEDMDIFYESDGWFVAMPRTVEASRKLGQDTVWCTARKDSNMFRSYVARLYNNVIIFYLIKLSGNPVENRYDKLSIGFIDGEPVFENEYENITVNSANQDMSREHFDNILGKKLFKKFLVEMTKRLHSINGIHPIKKELEKIVSSYEEYTSHISTFATKKRKEFNQDIREYPMHPDIQEIVLQDLGYDMFLADFALNPSLTLEIQKRIATSDSSMVRGTLANRLNLREEIQEILMRDKDDLVREALARNSVITLKTQKELAENKNQIIIEALLSNKKVSKTIKKVLKKRISP